MTKKTLGRLSREILKKFIRHLDQLERNVDYASVDGEYWIFMDGVWGMKIMNREEFAFDITRFESRSESEYEAIMEPLNTPRLLTVLKRTYNVLQVPTAKGFDDYVEFIGNKTKVYIDQDHLKLFPLSEYEYCFTGDSKKPIYCRFLETGEFEGIVCPYIPKNPQDAEKENDKDE